MLDLLLDRGGDLMITDGGDVQLTDSIAQAIQVRLKWFLSEWRFGPGLGVPYYEQILVKNPNTLHIRQLLREQIMSVQEVTDVPKLELGFNRSARRLNVRYTAVAGSEHIREEVVFIV